MKKYLLTLCLMFFSLSAGTSEAAPQIQQEIVDALKPKLNSDRIEYFFGSYGVDVLNIQSSAFPGSRFSNLYSVSQGQKIMRTLAIVDFFQPSYPELSQAHREVMEGKSIGIALRDNGWILHKKPVYFGSTSLSPGLMRWMEEPTIGQGALHIYRLEVSKNGQHESIPYCTIIEVHSPQYLTIEWLQALYPEQYQVFSVQSKEVTAFLCRLTTLIQNFPFPANE